MRWQGAHDDVDAAPDERAGRSGLPHGYTDRRDLIGLVLAGATACWALVAAGNGGAAGPFVGLIAASTVVFAAARVAGSVRPWIVPAGIVLLAGVLAAGAGSDVLSREPLSGPLGYANADAAFYLLTAIAALVLVATLSRSGLKVAAGGVAIGCAAVTVFKHSTAASSLLALSALGFVAGVRVSVRSIVAVCAALFLAALGITIALAVIHRSDLGQGIVEPVVDSGLSERRLALWDEALVLMLEHPMTGIGPGRFASFSPTARSDKDARWAHNEFLQQGAEQGIPGFAFTTGLFLWGFWRLGSMRHPDRFTAFGAVALAAIGIQASVDYILHFPAVALAMAALLGAATVDRSVDTGRAVVERPWLRAHEEKAGRR